MNTQSNISRIRRSLVRYAAGDDELPKLGREKRHGKSMLDAILSGGPKPQAPAEAPSTPPPPEAQQTAPPPKPSAIADEAPARKPSVPVPSRPIPTKPPQATATAKPAAPAPPPANPQPAAPEPQDAAKPKQQRPTRFVPELEKAAKAVGLRASAFENEADLRTQVNALASVSHAEDQNIRAKARRLGVDDEAVLTGNYRELIGRLKNIPPPEDDKDPDAVKAHQSRTYLAKQLKGIVKARKLLDLGTDRASDQFAVPQPKAAKPARDPGEAVPTPEVTRGRFKPGTPSLPQSRQDVRKYVVVHGDVQVPPDKMKDMELAHEIEGDDDGHPVRVYRSKSGESATDFHARLDGIARTSQYSYLMEDHPLSNRVFAHADGKSRTVGRGSDRVRVQQVGEDVYRISGRGKTDFVPKVAAMRYLTGSRGAGDPVSDDASLAGGLERPAEFKMRGERPAEKFDTESPPLAERQLVPRHTPRSMRPLDEESVKNLDLDLRTIAHKRQNKTPLTEVERGREIMKGWLDSGLEPDRAEKLTGHLKQALEDYREYKDAHPDREVPDPLMERLERLEGRLGTINPAIASVALRDHLQANATGQIVPLHQMSRGRPDLGLPHTTGKTEKNMEPVRRRGTLPDQGSPKRKIIQDEIKAAKASKMDEEVLSRFSGGESSFHIAKKTKLSVDAVDRILKIAGLLKGDPGVPGSGTPARILTRKDQADMRVPPREDKSALAQDGYELGGPDPSTLAAQASPDVSSKRVNRLIAEWEKQGLSLHQIESMLEDATGTSRVLGASAAPMAAVRAGGGRKARREAARLQQLLPGFAHGGYSAAKDGVGESISGYLADATAAIRKLKGYDTPDSAILNRPQGSATRSPGPRPTSLIPRPSREEKRRIQQLDLARRPAPGEQDEEAMRARSYPFDPDELDQILEAINERRELSRQRQLRSLPKTRTTMVADPGEGTTGTEIRTRPTKRGGPRYSSLRALERYGLREAGRERTRAAADRARRGSLARIDLAIKQAAAKDDQATMGYLMRAKVAMLSRHRENATPGRDYGVEDFDDDDIREDRSDPRGTPDILLEKEGRARNVKTNRMADRIDEELAESPVPDLSEFTGEGELRKIPEIEKKYENKRIRDQVDRENRSYRQPLKGMGGGEIHAGHAALLDAVFSQHYDPTLGYDTAAGKIPPKGPLMRQRLKLGDWDPVRGRAAAKAYRDEVSQGKHPDPKGQQADRGDLLRKSQRPIHHEPDETILGEYGDGLPSPSNPYFALASKAATRGLDPIARQAKQPRAPGEPLPLADQEHDHLDRQYDVLRESKVTT